MCEWSYNYEDGYIFCQVFILGWGCSYLGRHPCLGGCVYIWVGGSYLGEFVKIWIDIIIFG